MRIDCSAVARTIETQSVGIYVRTCHDSFAMRTFPIFFTLWMEERH